VKRQMTHPRTVVVAEAAVDIAKAVATAEMKYELTAIETLKILNEIAAGSLKYGLRVERHGDPEYPADAPPVLRRRKQKKTPVQS
jgi:hypothetical protein